MFIPIVGDGVSPWNDKPHRHYTLFVPLTQNDGSQQPPERLDWMEAELVKRAGGLTRYHPGDGLWMPPMGSAICRDKVVPFHIVMDDSMETEAWLVAFVGEIAQVFEQEEVFVFSQPVWLLERVDLAVQAPLFSAN